MYNYNATCTRVVDGDTVDAIIDLGFAVHVKKIIRLAGINAPESRTRDKQEKILGLAAKDRLIAMLNSADNNFELESKEVGKYGRVLGTLHIDKLDGKDVINKVLIEISYLRQDFNKLDHIVASYIEFKNDNEKYSKWLTKKLKEMKDESEKQEKSISGGSTANSAPAG